VEDPWQLGIRSGGSWMGSAGLCLGFLGLSSSFLFFVFYLIYQGGNFNRLSKN
jgi:hypothetical protein